jgi:hypothetical protein
MIKEFEIPPRARCKAPYIECKIGLHRFNARIDTGADITCIPSYAIPNDSKNAFSILIIGNKGICERMVPKIVTIEIENLGIFPMENGVLPTELPCGIIGMDILNLCSFSMVGEIFILELVEVTNEFNKEQIS